MVGITSTVVGDARGDPSRTARPGWSLRCSSSSTPSGCQPAQRVPAHGGVVLADPGGERDGVDGAQHREVGADVLADPVEVDVEGELARRRRPSTGAAGAPRGSRCRRPGPISPDRRLSRSRSSSTPMPAVRHRWNDDGRVDVAGRGCPSPGPRAASGPSRCRRGRPPRSRARGRPVAEVQHDHGRASSSGPAAGARRPARRRTRARCRGSRTGGSGARSATSRVDARSVARARRHGRGRTRCRRRRRAAASGKRPRGPPRCRRGRPGCAAARAATSSPIAASTSSSTTVGPEKRSPPCTTRCPTATGASVSPPVRSNAASTRSQRRGVVGDLPRRGRGSAPTPRWTMPASSSPIRSTSPDAHTCSASPSTVETGTSATTSRS